MIRGTKCNAIVKSTSHDVFNRNIQNSNSLSLIVIIELQKIKRKKRKEKNTYTSCISLSAHIFGLKQALSVLLFTYTGC